MKNSYATIFFDWGGVIADDPGDEFLDELLCRIGATNTQIEEIGKIYMPQFMRGHITEAEYWAAIAKRYNLLVPDSISEEFEKWSGLVANQEILDLVNEIKSKGLQVAVLSNVIEPTYNVLEKAGYYALFENVIGSCKEGLAKPQTEIYELALERLHASAEQSIFIDDKQKNLTPATEMGFTTILAANPQQIITDIRRLLF